MNLKKIALAFVVLASLLAPTPGRAQLSQATVLTDINQQLLSCGNGCNTAATLRGLLDVLTTATFQAQGLNGLFVSGTPSAGTVLVATTGLAASWTLSGAVQFGSIALNQTIGGCTNLPGVRAPFYVCNDNNGTNAAGYALGWEVWIGNNPTAAISANNAVATFVYIDNTNGRLATWAVNYVCNQLPVALGGSVSINHCIEIDTVQSQAAFTPTSAYSAGPVTHGIEFESSNNASASPQQPQVAVWVSSAADKASAFPWWQFGFSCARTNLACVVGENISGDVTTPFSQGFLWDKSSSVNTLLVAGTHTSIIDVSGATFTNLINCGNVACLLAGSINIKGPGATSGSTALTIQNSVPTTFVSFRDDGLISLGGSQLFNATLTVGGYGATSGTFAFTVNNSTPANMFTVRNDGQIAMALLPASAGGGGLFICVDSVGVLYKKATCP